MAWQTPRRNQDGVKTQLKFGMLGMRHQPGLRGRDDALLLARRDGVGRFIEACAGLYLDKGNEIAPARHEIDLEINARAGRERSQLRCAT